MCAELITREAQYLDTLELVVERTQTCVLRGKASITCDVDDEQHLIAELVEVDLFAGDARHFEFIDRRHGA